MSTSSETMVGEEKQADAAEGQNRAAKTFDYPSVARDSVPCRTCQFERLRSAGREKESLDQVARNAHEQGVREGEARTQVRLEQAVASERQAISQALAEFARQREAYYLRVEGEVVQLSLSIARKILHREAQMDPLLLAGVARVALEKVKEGTRVRLHVAPAKAESFREFFSRHADQRIAPEVVEDTAVAEDRCLLETDVGCTALGIEEQLKEVEQNFFDLLAQRPKT